MQQFSTDCRTDRWGCGPLLLSSRADAAVLVSVFPRQKNEEPSQSGETEFVIWHFLFLPCAQYVDPLYELPL
jgi:hypothetical protein